MDRSVVRLSFLHCVVLSLINEVRCDRKHYIPLSSSYAELYNIHTFFSGFPTAIQINSTTVLTRPHSLPELPPTSDGEDFTNDKALKDIAEAGRDWAKKYVRKEDMEVRSFVSSRVVLVLTVRCATGLRLSVDDRMGGDDYDGVGGKVNFVS